MAVKEEVDIVINIRKDAERSLTQLRKKWLSTKGAIIATGIAITSTSLAIIAAVKAAAEFETSMANVNTLLNLNNEQLNDLGDQVLNLGKTLPVEGSLLSEGLYTVISSGITDATKAIETLEASARLGIAGLGTTGEAVDLLTTAVNNFSDTGMSAEEIANVLFETVQAGKTTVAELARSFGVVAPFAKSAGVSFEEMQAATAALTVVTGKTSEAQNALRQLFVETTRSTGKLADAFKGAGIENVKMSIKNKGLKKTLQQLLDSVDGDTVAFQNLFSSIEGAGAGMQLLTSVSDTYDQTLLNLTDDVSSLQAGVDIQTDTFAAQWQILKNNLTPILIELGEEILPIVTDAVRSVTQWLDDNSTQITIWISNIGAAARAAQEFISVLSSLTRGQKIFSRSAKESILASAKLGKTAEEVSIQMEKERSVMKELGSAANDLGKEILGVGGGGGSATEKLKDKGSDDVNKFVENTINDFEKLADSIKSIEQKIGDLVGDFVSGEEEDRAELAEAIVKQEEDIENLKKDKMDAEKERREAETEAERNAADEKLSAIEQDLFREVAARERNSELLIQLDNEVSEVRRKNSLTTLEVAIEKFQEEREAARELFEEKIEQLELELQAVFDQRADIVKEIRLKNEELKDLYGEDTEKFKAEMDAQLLSALITGQKMLSIFRDVRIKRDQLLGSSGGAVSLGGIAPGFSGGSIVERQSGGDLSGTTIINKFFITGPVSSKEVAMEMLGEALDELKFNDKVV